jgi:acyl carrier protein
MQSAVSKALGIRISHLVPIEEDQIERTATGKLKRNALVEGLRLGRWKTLRAKPNRWYDYTEGLSWLKEQWKEILELEFEPGGDENFFDLGGDSLACAQLLFAVEEKYHCRLSLDAFFDNPTPSNMGELVRAATPQAGRTWKHDEEPSDQSSLLRKLQTFTASWRGRRFFSDSMIVGFNVDGHRPPIFWILQKYDEASQLAKHLGPDQPLYAMRSCVGIIEGAIYTPEVMETIGNRYLWEMLAVQVDDSFILGGTCQGGVLALGLARRLRQIGRPPIVLALLEWNFSLGSYAEPALLIYGEESFTADVYLRPDTAAIKWREDFPQSAVVSVPGVHEDVAHSDVSIAALAKILKAQNEGYVTLSPMDGRASRRLATALAIREAEATEYRAQLKSTAAELKKLKASRSWRVTAPFRSLAATLARLRAW